MHDLLQVAMPELGVREVPGSEHNPRILQFAREVGLRWIDDDETPWCSIFLNWCAMRAGLEQTGSPRARSWLEVGEERSPAKARPGDVLVLERGGFHAATGHVAIYLGHHAGGELVYGLGGNQGNAVSIGTFPADRVLPGGLRRLRRVALVPPAPLHLGERDRKVRLLQKSLERLGFDPGPCDGIFGRRTEAALRAFQYQAFCEGLLTSYGEHTNRYDEATATALRAMRARVEEARAFA